MASRRLKDALNYGKEYATTAAASASAEITRLGRRFAEAKKEDEKIERTYTSKQAANLYAKSLGLPEPNVLPKNHTVGGRR